MMLLRDVRILLNEEGKNQLIWGYRQFKGDKGKKKQLSQLGTSNNKIGHGCDTEINIVNSCFRRDRGNKRVVTAKY